MANHTRSNLRCNLTTCVGTCVRITKVVQYSSIRPPLLWAVLAVPAGPREVRRTYGAHRARSLPFPNLANLSLSRSLLPLPGCSFRSSNAAIQISQPDFILVSRIFFIAPDPGASPRVRSLLSPSLRAYSTRAPYIINAGNSVYAQSTRSGGLQVRPHVQGLLIGQFTRCTFSYATRSHGDTFTDR